ncbi:Hypothetical predicted protein [Podarcis lilfordi]|uniref:Uncharacterized protein n=1 Tax=Podarcis lilfordi TaxID=74358 RepID=A0AA35NX26_9SAUR|nr:Hypothetical predicted protein [Podarcis lilfordi]
MTTLLMCITATRSGRRLVVSQMMCIFLAETSVWPEKDLRITHQEIAMELNSKEQSSSPQKQGVKARSKSTEEIQPAKKAFHTPQKSLPNQMDGDDSKGSCPVPAPNTIQQQQQT